MQAAPLAFSACGVRAFKVKLIALIGIANTLALSAADFMRSDIDHPGIPLGADGLPMPHDGKSFGRLQVRLHPRHVGGEERRGQVDLAPREQPAQAQEAAGQERQVADAEVADHRIGREAEHIEVDLHARALARLDLDRAARAPGQLPQRGTHGVVVQVQGAGELAVTGSPYLFDQHVAHPAAGAGDRHLVHGLPGVSHGVAAQREGSSGG